MGMVGAPRRGDVYLVSLDPTRGREIRKTRPCVVVSPDELNDHLGTFIVAPMTTGTHPYPFRIPCSFEGRRGFVVADQVRTVDHARPIQRVGRLREDEIRCSLKVLSEMFAE